MFGTVLRIFFIYIGPLVLFFISMKGFLDFQVLHPLVLYSEFPDLFSKSE